MTLTLRNKAPVATAVEVADREAERYQLADRLAQEIAAKHLSPKGTLGLSPELDEKRHRYGICDEAFLAKPAFDRVYVKQIEPRYQEGKTYGGTSLWMPETAQKRELQESCRGVLVSAGLKALDNLKSNGIQVGDTVEFIRFGIFHKPICALSGGHLEYLLVLRDGDIIGSEEIVDRERAGAVKFVEEQVAVGVFETRVVTEGKEYRAREAFVDESY